MALPGAPSALRSCRSMRFHPGGAIPSVAPSILHRTKTSSPWAEGAKEESGKQAQGSEGGAKGHNILEDTLSLRQVVLLTFL